MDLGGLERVVLDLVNQGRQLGQDVTVICLERPGILAPRVQAAGAQLLCVDKPPGIHLSTIRHIRSLLAKLRPDVVHTHQINPLFYTGPAARSLRIPVVHTEHGKHYAAHRRTRLLGRLAGRFAQRVFCVSDDIAQEITTHRIASPDKVEVVRNGIDTRRFQEPADTDSLRQSLGIPLDAPVIGTIGRLSEIKRQDLLLRAFHDLRTNIPNAHLLLVGDGPLLSELRQLATTLGLDGSIHFAGYQPEPQQFLHLMNVFTLTSRSEGMPLVILEAWAAGVPIVASDAGGLPELIQHGQTGLLFPSGDVQALATAIGQMLTDPAYARTMAEAGLRRVESTYHARHMAETYHARYLNLISSPPPRVITPA
jgi:glycosyltransferase involved in cell wall biosynthesis